jgi:pSer/pThr/pTyr-binding forkhead associated (FHA) protein
MTTRDAKEWETSYKYNCRMCPIRARCILKSHTSSVMKDAIRNAFINRADSKQMWDILQENCLLSEARAEAELYLTQEPLPPQETSPLPPPQEPSTPLAPPVIAEAPPPPALAEAPPPPTEEVEAYYLIAQPSKRRIALPDDGELVLGRFDPSIGLSADVDLRHDDKGKMTVSRRHARVSSFRGSHAIEDLGSTNGTRVNDHPLKLGEIAYLRPGDRIALGDCQLSYEPMPEWIAELPADVPRRYFLLVTATGHRFDLPTGAEEVTIGRIDPTAGGELDIDLRGEGGISLCVSRRHARLSWEEGGHFLEDLESTFGTRVNGSIVWSGDRVRLKPGDHMWLGGCVVAYDLELE